jgi:catechol 2,3-dioxygenase
MRVFMENDLDPLKAYFEQHGCPAAWVDVPHQGRTLHAADPAGTPLEFCATMPVLPRMITKFTRHAGGSALRLDHYQIITPEVRKACDFYMAAGFRLSEYIAPPGTFDLRGVFLQRKGNPHDIVFFNGIGPRLHHFAFLAPEVHHLLHACDLAGELGFGASVERGPGRHGPGHAMYVYMRDPDGHRVELFNTHYQLMDIENEPIAWDPADQNISFPWGLPARQAWFEEATVFSGVVAREPQVKPAPMTLEKYLALQDAP